MSSLQAPQGTIQLSSDLWSNSDELIQKILVVAQRLQLEQFDPASKDEDIRSDVPHALKQHRSLLAALHVSTTISDLVNIVSTLAAETSSGTSAAAPQFIARFVPFVQTVSHTFSAVVARQAYAVKSTYKLSYVVGRIMLDLAQKGFCKPQEESDSKNDGQDGETVEGTGMGAGTGDKNVSSEIEEEGQVEGLQGEEEEEEDKQGKDDENEDEDDAISMANDFEGELGGGREKKGEDSGDEEEEDHDEHVGDVDPLDPGAVDEKFWGDEEKPEEESGGREDLTEQQTQEQSGEAELSAKDERSGKQPESKEKEKEEPKEGEEAETGAQQGVQQEEGEEGDEDMEDTAEDENGLEDDGMAPPQQDEVAVPEGDKLDLPEDLNFDGSEAGEENEGDDLGDDIALSVDGDEPREESDDADMASNDDGEMAEDAPPATAPTEEESNEPEATLNHDLDLSASNDALAQESAEMGRGQGAGEQKREEEGGEEEKMDVAEEDAENESVGQG